MGFGNVLNRLMANISTILLVSLVLAACVGIGSLITQYSTKDVIDYALSGQLALIFWVIAAFMGLIFSIVSKPAKA